MEQAKLNSVNGVHVDSDVEIREEIEKIIEQREQTTHQNSDSPFFLVDLRKIKHQYLKWKSLMPRVELFYAVKVCSEVSVLKLLADMGSSFDCASQREMEIILSLGVDSSRIIFANTVKFISSLQFASDNNVSLMTFDNEEELYKIKKLYPEAKLVLRIRCADSPKVEHNFGIKFGCSLDNVPRLLQKARSLQASVVGVSFHVGSGASDPVLYTTAIKDAHAVFDMGKTAGFNFDLLDIGGGFIGHDETEISFEMMTKKINACLDKYFPVSTGVRIIAEPGSFVVTTAYTLVLQVVGKRSNETSEKGIVYEMRQQRTVAPRFLYYVNDGRNGSVPNEIATLPPIQTLSRKGKNTTYSSVLFGPTCDSFDVLYSDISLPELYIGDWLYLENAGAYSMVLASDFNMMPRVECYYVSLDTNNER